MRMVFLAGLIDAVTEKGRRLLALDGPERTHPPTADTLLTDAQALLTSRGEASLVVAARSLLDAYSAAPKPIRLQFLRRVTELLGPTPLPSIWRLPPTLRTRRSPQSKHCTRPPSRAGRSSSAASISPPAVHWTSCACARTSWRD